MPLAILPHRDRPAIPGEEEDSFMPKIGKQTSTRKANWIGMGTLALLLFIAAVILPFGPPSAARIPHSRIPHSPQSNAAAANLIDGSQHPELIPDSTAYRLYLLTISELPNASEQDRNRQNAHLAKLRLNDKDRQTLITVLAEFKSQHTTLVNRYNQAATAALARGIQPDPTTFLQQRDDLVQATQNAIQRILGADGMLRLDAHVQAEKQRMTIYKTKEGPQ